MKHEQNTDTEEEMKKDAKEMCNSCIHKYYCMVAFKKDHWCGNYKKNSFSRGSI